MSLRTSVALTFGLLFAAPVVPAAHDGELVIIANPHSNFHGIDSEVLRQLVMLKTQKIEGRRVTLLLPHTDSAEFRQIAATLRVQPYVIDRWWARARYSGLVSLPEVRQSADEIIRDVKKMDNAIGVINDSVCVNACEGIVIQRLD